MDLRPPAAHVPEPGNRAVPETPPPVTESEALGLLRSIDKLAKVECPPYIEIGSAHHTLCRALEDIQVIASGTIAWRRTHADGVCHECTDRNEPWYCFHV